MWLRIQWMHKPFPQSIHFSCFLGEVVPELWKNTWKLKVNAKQFIGNSNYRCFDFREKNILIQRVIASIQIISLVVICEPVYYEIVSPLRHRYRRQKYNTIHLQITAGPTWTIHSNTKRNISSMINLFYTLWCDGKRFVTESE